MNIACGYVIKNRCLCRSKRFFFSFSWVVVIAWGILYAYNGHLYVGIKTLLIASNSTLLSEFLFCSSLHIDFWSVPANVLKHFKGSSKL